MAGVSVKRVRAIARHEAKSVLEEESETKYVDTVVASAAVISSTPTAGYTGMRVSAISQGPDLFNRLGDSVRCVSLLVRWHAALSAAAVTAQGTSYLRLIVLVDRAASGSVPPAFQGVTESPYTNNGPLASPPSVPMHPRYAILRDKMIKLGWGSNSVSAGRMYMKLKYKTHFAGSSSSDANIGLNPIYVIPLSSDATNGPTCTIYARLRFMDV